jgi:signal transduction histidine kinase/DNA-binding response OmpR family regulator
MDVDKVNILIVDDKPDKLLALEALLEELGQNIVRAYSGREALRCLLNDDFAVILLDVNMPGMDGFETAALIRQRKSTEHIPIIFVTAFGDENHASRGYQLGAVDYIQTPVVSEVLKTKVSVFVDLYKKTEQVRRQAHWLRQRATQLHKLTGASLSINSAMSTERMLKIVTDTAREIIGAHRASTTVVHDSNWQHATTVVSASDKYAAWPEGEQNPGGQGIQSLVCRMNKPIRMTQRELQEHPVWQAHRVEPVGAASGGRPAPMRGWLAAPLTGRDGRNLGIVEVTDKHDEGEFTEDDEAMLVQLAQMASIAIENTIFAEERETNRIKDEFLSTLSHELRTPLNAILGWTQLLRVSPLEGEVGHAMEVIERNARAQAKLVEDLLDVSRVTTGKLRLTARPLNFSGVIRSAVDAVRPVAEEKQVALECFVADDDRISGDADRLQQVVWNLLTNAVKFTPAGGHVEVRLDRIGSSLRLRVTDTGRGIAPTFLPYVFDRFRQADSTSTRSHGGLGIGLTIVRHIVELHHGAVHAESAGEGQGATFIVTLPAMSGANMPAVAGETPDASALAGATGAAAGASAAAVSSGAAGANGTPLPGIAARPSSTTADLSGLRVVVVDDEPDARDVIARILTRAGATTTVAASVREALAAITRDRPDVIVSDIAMPNEDGYDLIRILREMSSGGETAGPAGPAGPALALTAYAREEDKLRCLSAGFEAHLAKPVDPAELLGVVAHLAAAAQPELKYG